ncbi:MAG: hypothetical protein AAGF83_16310 [Cyanobacteria bacterium P01_G01_bin.67]
MKIENFNKTITAERSRVSATLIWENCDRPAQEVYFETTKEFAADLHVNPNSWLLCSALAAMRYGEKRIVIDAPISPEVKDGLINAMKCLIDWHGGERQVIEIEAPIQTEVLFPNKSPRAGALFSGGIDALAMVRDNHLNFASDHPRRIQDGILVYGVLEGENEQDPSFQNVVNAVTAMAEDAGLNLIQLYTNAYAHFRDLDADFSFWRFEYHGSFLAAIAHAFAPRLSVVSIASTYDFANLEPWGSHPLLDPLYSTTSLQVRHENAALSRLEKTKLVGEWDVALKQLRVCNEKASYQAGNYNCGNCEKCVRTMTAFLALGMLEQIATFKETNVSKEKLVDTCYLSDSYEVNCYRELIEPLEKIGRHDLVEGIEQIIDRYYERDLKGMIKRLDRTLFDGNLLSLGKKLKSSAME